MNSLSLFKDISFSIISSLYDSDYDCWDWKNFDTKMSKSRSTSKSYDTETKDYCFNVLETIVSNHLYVFNVLDRFRYGLDLNLIFDWNFLGGFILGFLALVIVINVLKLQVGRYRPYLLSICPDFCSNNSNCTEDLGNKMIEARKSFPSLTSSLSTYAALFMILYLAAAINHRAGRMIRTIMSVCLVIGSLSISINRVLAFKSHLSDVIVGIIIGSLFAIYIVFIHLNSFANILSKTNPFSSRKRWTIKKILGYDDSDDDNNNDGDDNDKIDHHQYNRNLISEEIKFWNQFRIPRVRTDFVSTLNRKPEIMTLDRNGDYRSRFNYNLPLSSRPSSVQNPLNAYVNPAFDDQSESNFGKKSSTHSFSQKPSASRLRSFN